MFFHLIIPFIVPICTYDEMQIPYIEKVIQYKFYITEQARQDFATKNQDINDAINGVVASLEGAVNKVMEKSQPPMKISWNMVEQTENVNTVDLTTCGQSMKEAGIILHEYFMNDSETSTIAMSNCDTDLFVDFFNSAGLSSPYVTHVISTYCTTRTLIFFEPENDKFTSMFGTALLKAAGIRHPNPLKLEEVTNGDEGKELVLTLHDEAMKQLRETKCFGS